MGLNILGTLAMLAGNVLGAGSMGMLGNVLVATGETVQAGAKNDASGTVFGALKIGTGITSGTLTEEARTKSNFKIAFKWRNLMT